MPGVVPELSPESEHRIRGHFATVAFNLFLGAEITLLASGRCELAVQFREELAQQDGYFHGGVIATLADSGAGHAALTLMGAGHRALTGEFKVNFLAPARGERLLMRSRVIKHGGTLTIAQSDAFTFRNGEETHCATALVTYMGFIPRG